MDALLYLEMQDLDGLFKELPANEESAFRQWARDNYKPGADIKPVWHPAVQDECHAINTETDNAI